MYKCHSITTVLFFYSTFLIYILPYNILISILIYISTSITKVFFLVSLKMTGTGYRYPSTGCLHAIIAHHFKIRISLYVKALHDTLPLVDSISLAWMQSLFVTRATRACFSSFFSRFSRISQLLDYAHLPSYACPHNPPNTFRIWNFIVIDPLLKNVSIYPSVNSYR